MIGQGVYVRSSSPPRAPASPPLDPCNSISSEVLAFCSSFNTATTSRPAPPTPAPPAPSELRRLAKAPHPTHILKCPRCASLDTKFCYYNNYSLSQPRYFCKNCKRYWTAGGVLRNVPVGGGLRKNKRSKLKLAAEAEAATARDLSAQQQYCEGKPPSPVHVASACAMGSSDTTANSCVVSGVPANYLGVAPPSYLPSRNPTATHLPRTSSEISEGSAIDSSCINESCTASAGAVAFLREQQQSCGQFQGLYGDTGVVHVGRPQYYASNASTIVGLSCNVEQYSGTSGEGSRSCSYHAVGYAGSCTDQSMGSLTSAEQVVGSNGDGFSASFSVGVDKGIDGGSDVSGNHASIQDSSNSSYDWQFMSENLFNGTGTEGLLPMSGGSWPDFSQFHDPTGSG